MGCQEMDQIAGSYGCCRHQNQIFKRQAKRLPYPKDPCMEYLPTLGLIILNYFRGLM